MIHREIDGLSHIVNLTAEFSPSLIGIEVRTLCDWFALAVEQNAFNPPWWRKKATHTARNE